MNKIWYINIDGKQEGPFSILDLKKDTRITPETLVWKEGFPNWKPIGQVPELKDVFADESPNEEKKPEETKKSSPILPQDEIVLDMRNEPPYFFWLLLLVAILVYFLTQIFWT